MRQPTGMTEAANRGTGPLWRRLASALAALALLLHGFAPLVPMAHAAALPLGPDGLVLVLCSSGGPDGGPNAPAPLDHHDAAVPCVLCAHWTTAATIAPGGIDLAAPRRVVAVERAPAAAPAPAPSARHLLFAARAPPIA